MLKSRAFWIALFLVLALPALYFSIALNWSYSSGERAGWVQKLSKKGWLCKTWEGELALVSMPGAAPEKFEFTVHDEAVAERITTVDADDTPRRIRLVRTPAEIRMMRLASQANIAAANATVLAARELGSVRAIRQRFFAEAALRGNLGVFMVVNASSSEAYDEPLRDGQAFLIDCVSHLRNFHGDFGRTVFIGEPTARMRRCTDVMATTWGELQGLIRPGLRFSQVRELGAATLAKFGLDVPVSFSPHSVGLAHTDHPRFNADGSRADVMIEENMILSIDCPLFETGQGGTAHLEDLVLVTPAGAVPIHETGTPTYTV